MEAPNNTPQYSGGETNKNKNKNKNGVSHL